MSPWLVWPAVACGMLLLVARRRSAAVLLVSVQGLLVGAGAVALSSGHSAEVLTTSLLLLGRALALGSVLWIAVARTRQTHPVADDMPAIVRVAGGGGLALAISGLMPHLGLLTRASEVGAVALVAMGIALLIVRRAGLFQVLGLLVAENGVAMGAVSVPGGLPVVIEIGIAFDVVLVVVVATAFHERIFSAFGTTDTAALRSLRD